MKQDHTAAANDTGELQENIEERLDAIESQGRQTLELLKALIGMLLPKEGAREGQSLEELLAKLIAQQREAITIGKITQADLRRLGETLPEAVAEAVGTCAGIRRAVRL